MNIEIQDGNKFLSICRTFSWLDNRRWGIPENYNLLPHDYDLTASQMILTHWITYITDRQMPFGGIWDRGGLVFSDLVFEYSKKEGSIEDLLNSYYFKVEEKGKKRYYFKSRNGNEFASRFITVDYKNILQTLEMLDNSFDRNIIKFVVEIMQNRQSTDAQNLLRQVACAMHQMTYQLNKSVSDRERVLRMLKNPVEFDRVYHKFTKNATENKKRLWCCIRDYKKGYYHGVFLDGIRQTYPSKADELISLWDGLSFYDLELPGDVWNNSSYIQKNLLAKVLKMEDIPKSWGSPRILRNVYEQLKLTNNLESLYPEQWDITFDFIPRMCTKKLCDVCPFGPEGVEKICIPSGTKDCPVALITCGYRTRCIGNERECIIRDNLTRGICDAP